MSFLARVAFNEARGAYLLTVKGAYDQEPMMAIN